MVEVTIGEKLEVPDSEVIQQFSTYMYELRDGPIFITSIFSCSSQVNLPLSLKET